MHDCIISTTTFMSHRTSPPFLYSHLNSNSPSHPSPNMSPSQIFAEVSIQSWEKIDPELLLYLFLPALLFGEAMTLRW